MQTVAEQGEAMECADRQAPKAFRRVLLVLY